MKKFTTTAVKNRHLAAGKYSRTSGYMKRDWTGNKEHGEPTDLASERLLNTSKKSRMNISGSETHVLGQAPLPCSRQANCSVS